MALISLDRNPSARLVRQFGLVWFPGFMAVGGGLALYRSGSWRVALAMWTTGLGVTLAGIWKPVVMRRLWFGWMLATYPIAWTISQIAVILFYYGVITPLGLILRAVRYDPLSRSFDRSAQSYWTARDSTADKSQYFRQS